MNSLDRSPSAAPTLAGIPADEGQQARFHSIRAMPPVLEGVLMDFRAGQAQAVVTTKLLAWWRKELMVDVDNSPGGREPMPVRTETAERAGLVSRSGDPGGL
jgi:hypothetical protein